MLVSDLAPKRPASKQDDSDDDVRISDLVNPSKQDDSDDDLPVSSLAKKRPAEDPPAKKKRGRPPKSKSKPKTLTAEEEKKLEEEKERRKEENRQKAAAQLKYRTEDLLRKRQTKPCEELKMDSVPKTATAIDYTPNVDVAARPTQGRPPLNKPPKPLKMNRDVEFEAPLSTSKYS